MFLITRHIALATSFESSPAVVIIHSTTTVPAAKSSNIQSNGGSGLNGGEIAGIVVGILGAILTAAGVYIAWKMLKMQKTLSQPVHGQGAMGHGYT